MSNVIVTFNNGDIKEFIDGNRSGGSFCNSVRYEGQFVIIKDEWGTEHAYPASNIEKVVTETAYKGF